VTLPSYAPQVFFGAGTLCLLAAVRKLIRQRRILEVIPSSNFTVQLPTKWNDAEITRLLQGYHDQPAVLSHVVSSIKTRMILGQDLKTAQQRLRLMASVLDVFKLNKEMQSVLHGIHLDQKEFEIQQVETQMRREDADARLKSERQLRDLRKQRDELQLNKEIALLRQEIKAVDKSDTVSQAAKLTPEEQRAKDKTNCEERISTLKAEKQNALKIEDESERVQRVNAIDDAIQQAMERWAKLL
jgi:hypothetical protein